MKIRKEIIITASSKFSIPAQVLAELLIKNKVNVSGIIVVNFLSFRRLKSYIKDRTMIKPFLKKFFNLIFVKRRKNNSILKNFIDQKKIKLKNNLSKWCKDNKVPIYYVNNLNSQKSIKTIKNSFHDLVIYCGGGIIRENFLKNAKCVINAHAGPLPEIRGMNAAEWTYLLKKKSAITIHLIDEGIDTGKILDLVEYDIKKCTSIKELRELAIVTGLEALVEAIKTKEITELKNTHTQNNLERQCFIMTPILMEILESRLKYAEIN